LEKTQGSEYPEVATVVGNLAALYLVIGSDTKVEPFLRRALAIREKTSGPEHPLVAATLHNLAILAAAQRNYPSAVSLLKRSLQIEERTIQNVFSFTTEPEKLRFIQSTSGNYMAYLSLLHQQGRDQQDLVRDGMELVLRRKGIVFDAQARVHEGLQGRMPESARKEWDRLSVLRGEYARLLLKKPERMSSELHRERLTALQKDIDTTEKTLAGQSALVAGELKQRNITVEVAAKAVPENGVLVEFVRIEDFDFSKGTRLPSARYLAFLLTSAGDVTLVDLGEATKLEKEIQGTIESIRVALNRRDLSSITHSQQSLAGLYTSLWSPLVPVFGSADHIVLSPDGLLNLIPFSALRAPDGRFLLERYHLAYVASGRELVSRGDSLVPPNVELLLVANPAFDDTISGGANPDAAVRSRDFGGTFSPLPGTAREANEIPPLVAGEGAKKQIMLGASATERVVKNVHNPRILHVATHGFFLGDQGTAMSQDTRGVSVVSASDSGEHKPALPPKRYENPLVRSGLAFAGANHAAETSEGDDGLLTALEITSMDLYGTELVVLSACETAVGDVQIGEGVFGLRRAFALAGAKNLLMSLWAVDDEVTANQMKAFYQHLQKLSPADALRQAQLETIQKLQARDGHVNPALWAPFILQGSQAFQSIAEGT
jgi:CHAT domain-containing protein